MKKLVLGALNTLQDVIRALREIERASADESVYLQDSDPGAVGAKKLWVHSDGTMRVRTADNSGWITVV